MDFEDDEPLSHEVVVRGYAVTLVSEATGGDATSMERVGYDEVDVTDLIEILRDAGVPLSAVLKEDLSRIDAGEEPHYFIRPERIAELYRAEYRINFDPKRWASAGIRDASVVRVK
mgnify:CR=1 FL=1